MADRIAESRTQRLTNHTTVERRGVSAVSDSGEWCIVILYYIVALHCIVVLHCSTALHCGNALHCDTALHCGIALW